MKRRVRAQRKFAQGLIPLNTGTSALSERRTDAPINKEEQRKVIQNNTGVTTLLDVITFNNIHKHKTPIVVLERLKTRNCNPNAINQKSPQIDSGNVSGSLSDNNSNRNSMLLRSHNRNNKKSDEDNSKDFSPTHDSNVSGAFRHNSETGGHDRLGCNQFVTEKEHDFSMDEDKPLSQYVARRTQLITDEATTSSASTYKKREHQILKKCHNSSKHKIKRSLRKRRRKITNGKNVKGLRRLHRNREDEQDGDNQFNNVSCNLDVISQETKRKRINDNMVGGGSLLKIRKTTKVRSKTTTLALTKTYKKTHINKNLQQSPTKINTSSNQDSPTACSSSTDFSDSVTPPANETQTRSVPASYSFDMKIIHTRENETESVHENNATQENTKEALQYTANNLWQTNKCDIDQLPEAAPVESIDEIHSSPHIVNSNRLSVSSNNSSSVNSMVTSLITSVLDYIEIDESSQNVTLSNSDKHTDNSCNTNCNDLHVLEEIILIEDEIDGNISEKITNKIITFSKTRLCDKWSYLYAQHDRPSLQAETDDSHPNDEIEDNEIYVEDNSSHSLNDSVDQASLSLSDYTNQIVIQDVRSLRNQEVSDNCDTTDVEKQLDIQLLDDSNSSDSDVVLIEPEKTMIPQSMENYLISKPHTNLSPPGCANCNVSSTIKENNHTCKEHNNYGSKILPDIELSPSFNICDTSININRIGNANEPNSLSAVTNHNSNENNNSQITSNTRMSTSTLSSNDHLQSTNENRNINMIEDVDQQSKSYVVNQRPLAGDVSVNKQGWQDYSRPSTSKGHSNDMGKTPAGTTSTSPNKHILSKNITYWQPRPGQSFLNAPVFTPTSAEFKDPVAFLDSIMPLASKYGICKVVPPPDFTPGCSVNDEMIFNVTNQYVTRLFSRWGPGSREMSTIKAYLASQSVVFKRAPLYDGMEVNLPKLYQIVQQHGGLKKVIERKRWSRVAEQIRFTKGPNPEKKLDQVYVKYLLPYDTLSSSERVQIRSRVERAWCNKYRKMMERSSDPLHRQKKMLGESDSSDEEECSDDDEYVMDALIEAEECVTHGRRMNLTTFKKIASNALETFFSNSTQPNTSEVEQEYWRLVLLGLEHLCVISASIDTGTAGYGFTNNKEETYGDHPWNLKNLATNTGNILRFLGSVLGVTVPTLHLGMIFSTSCWHRDPHGLPWMEFMHSGPPKIWYGIPDEQSNKFRKAVESLCPTSCQNKSIWLPSDIAMIPPNLLREQNVTLSRVEQHPGEFVIVFPKAYSCSICTGFTISESVYFASKSWLQSGLQFFLEAQISSEPTMMSLEALLIAIVRDVCTPLAVLQPALSMLHSLLQTELCYRRALEDELPANIKNTAIKVLKHPPGAWNVHEQDECEICRKSLYLSRVRGLTENNAPLCLEHAISVMQKKTSDTLVPDSFELTYYYTIEEIDSILKFGNNRMFKMD